MKSTISILSAALLVFGACGKDDKSAGGDSKEGSAKSSAKTSAKAASGKSAGLDGLFLGKSVTLPEEVAKVAFGKEEAENLKTLGLESNYKSSDEFKGVDFQMRSTKKRGSETKRTKSIEISIEEGLEAAATKAWGTPARDKEGLAYWFNPETKLRAYMSPYGKGKSLVIDPYQPLEEFLGATGFELAFAEGKVLLGASIEELHAAWGDSLCDYDKQGPKLIASYAEHRKDSLARFPPTYNSHIDLCWDMPRGAGTTINRDKLDIGENGRVSRFRMNVPTEGSSEITTSTLSFLNKKLGEAAMVETDGGKEHHYFSAENGLKVKALETKAHGIHIVFSEFLPLEKLLGGDGPGLGVEPEGVFGTFEDIAKADPDHFEPSGTLASLIYPGSEFSAGLTEVSLSKMSNAKKVSGYKVVLHYKGYPNLEAQILTLLAKRFGPARDSKRKASKGKYLDFGGQDQRKVSVWQVNDQFQITFSQ